MKSKIAYGLNLLWTSIVSFVFPFAFAWIYMDIIGHAKGYSYDLGEEADISIIIGCIELLIWIVLTLPSYIYVIRRTLNKGKKYLFLLIALYIVLAIIFIISVFGGWTEYARQVFNIE